jgi:hypothetical protein
MTKCKPLTPKEYNTAEGRIRQTKRIVALFNRLVENEAPLVQSMQRPTHLRDVLGIDRHEARFLRGLTKVLLDWENRK